MTSQRSKIITVDRLCCAKFSRVIFLIVLVEFDKVIVRDASECSTSCLVIHCCPVGLLNCRQSVAPGEGCVCVSNT
jgi:hypothetical protein